MAGASSKAIVLSRENFGEADQYVQFLTQKWGVISVLARSARKSRRRYVGGLDLFCHDEIFLRGEPKERPYLIELSVLNSFPRIRDDLGKLLVAGKVIQWVRKLADMAAPMPQVYSLVGQTLALVENEPDSDRQELLALVYKLKLLAQLGLKPRVEACVRCEEPETPHGLFDVASGGIVCRSCTGANNVREGLPLGQAERALLTAAEGLRWTAWSEISFPSELAAPLTRLVTQFASFHSHARLPI